MVEFSNNHKAGFPHPSEADEPTVDWYKHMGEPDRIDLTTLLDDQLWELRNSIQRFCNRQLDTIDRELNKWTVIECAVCGLEDLAFRGHPFITWGVRAGRLLCARHLAAYDRIGTPAEGLLKQARQEEKNIREIFS